MSNFEELLGKTITEFSVNDYKDEIVIKTQCGKTYKMHHDQSCCESVTVEDINGDIEDIVGSPLTRAEESSKYEEDSYGDEQWTFYKLDTVNGGIVIRWYGESNGYYSISVDFEELG